MKKKRISEEEKRLKNTLRGFGLCFEEILDKWRDIEDEDLRFKIWNLILKDADAEYSKLDKEYKKVMFPRVYGKEFK